MCGPLSSGTPFVNDVVVPTNPITSTSTVLLVVLTALNNNNKLTRVLEYMYNLLVRVRVLIIVSLDSKARRGPSCAVDRAPYH
jgi:hypothetical protein